MNHNNRQGPRRELRHDGYGGRPSSLNDGKPRKKKIRLYRIYLFVILIACVGGGVGITCLRQPPVNEANLPVIMESKEEACVKIRPNVSNNTPLPYDDISIYSELEERSREPVVEQLLPETEKPTLEVNAVDGVVDIPPIEVVQEDTGPMHAPSLVKENNQTNRLAQTSLPEQPLPARAAKPRESLNEAMQKTLHNIYNDAGVLIVENVTHGKKMPPIEQANATLKILSQKKQVKAPSSLANKTPALLKTVAAKKPFPPKSHPSVNSATKNYWVEFKPLSTSKEAEHMWHQLATSKSAKNALVGVQHKVQRLSSNGVPAYKLSAGPFNKDEAMVCCQKLRQVKINCRAVKK